MTQYSLHCLIPNLASEELPESNKAVQKFDLEMSDLVYDKFTNLFPVD